MNSEDIFKSPCCGLALVETEYTAKCSGCDQVILWAFQNDSWAQWEACGVFMDFSGKKYFAWTVTGKVKSAKEYLSRGSRSSFVCHVKSVVETIQLRWNRDGDCIPEHAHRSFVREWMPRVENPEVGGILLKKDRR